MEKKGQVTIFIIVAIVIVGLGLLVYAFYPQISSRLGVDVKNPQAFIQECVEDHIEDALETVSLQGGSIDPDHYTFHEEETVGYLCYTNEYSDLCSIQIALLRAHIEEEIRLEINDEVIGCFNSLRDSYKNKGYTVEMVPGIIDIQLLPKRVASVFDYTLTLTKGDTETYDSFDVVLENNLYELVAIAESIVDWEATYGDVETTAYMNYYPHLKVEYSTKSDGTKVYIITDRNREDKFQFASRSLIIAPGYAIR